MFKIEDEMHAEPQEGEFSSFVLALNELKKISSIPWGQTPNNPPCSNSENCERNYQIIEYDANQIPWKELQRITVLKVSAKGVEWKYKA